MHWKLHLKLFWYASVTWLAFYLIGLPDYYQSWPLWAKIVICIFVTWAGFPATRYSLKTLWQNNHHMTNSLWLAFYLTVPLFIYDYLLLAWYKGLGIGYVFPYWYLSFFYFSFWVQFPYVAWKMLKDEKTTEQHKVVAQ